MAQVTLLEWGGLVIIAAYNVSIAVFFIRQYMKGE